MASSGSRVVRLGAQGAGLTQAAQSPVARAWEELTFQSSQELNALTNPGKNIRLR